MSRTIAAIYDTRPEAELARERLAAEAKPRTMRILSKETVAAIDGLKIASSDAAAYREGLRNGGHLLVAEVPAGTSAKRIVELLQNSAGDAVNRREERAWADSDEGVQVTIPDDDADEEPPQAKAEPQRAAKPEPTVQPELRPVPQWPPARAPSEPARAMSGRPREDENRAAPRQMPADMPSGRSGGARVRSFTHESEAEEHVALREESIDVANRSSEREMSRQELNDAGVFKERVFEVAAMREEPIVTKVAIVRDEVIVRKIVQHRTETVRGTVRRTEIEVEDLPADGPPRFIGRDR